MRLSLSSMRAQLAGILLLASMPLLIALSFFLYLESTVSSPNDQHLLLSASAGFITYLMFLMTAWVILKRNVFRPFQLIQKKVRSIQHGQVTSPAPIDSPPEPASLLNRLHQINMHKLDAEHHADHQFASLQRRLRQLSGLINHSPLGIVEWGQDLNAVRWNQTAGKMLMLERNSPAAQSLHAWTISNADSNQELLQRMESLLKRSQESDVTQTMQTDKSGRVTVLRWHNSAHTDSVSNLTTILSAIEDVTSQYQESRNLRLTATHDPVTKLPNLGLMEQLLANATEAGARTSASSIAVILVDLGRLKLINNSLGLQTGNEVLKEACNRLQKNLRPKDKMGRLGSEELLVMLPDLESPRQIEHMVKRLDQSLEAPILVQERPHHLHTSMGVAMYPSQARSPEALIRKANIALNAAISNTDESYRIFDPELEKETQYRLTVETELREALRNKELDLYLQPFVSIRGEKLWGAEALIRWHHPERGLVYPAEFIPHAEESCLILELGQFVLEKSHKIAAEWNQMGKGDLKLSINLSARQFADPLLTEHLMSLQKTYQIVPGQIVIEITEATLLSATKESLDKMNLLKALGYLIALDNFGIGYASMNQFTQFPLDIVKIHRDYISEAVTNHGARALVVSIIQIAKRLNVQAIAEGVENKEERQLLEEESCDVLQGYLYGQAIPLSEFTTRHLKQSRVNTAVEAT